MKSDDLAALIANRGGPGVDLHVGLVKAWSADTGTNTIEVLGVDIYDVPVLTAAGIVSLRPGTSVVIMKYKDTYFVIGQVVSAGSELAQPQFAIPMYPQFASSLPAGTGGSAYVPTGVLVTWEGRFRPSHPRIELQGVWGNASGAGSTTYVVKIWGEVIGSWTATTVENTTKGPFDISQWVGDDWSRLEVSMTVSTGTGMKYFQVIAAYLRQAE